MVPHAADGALKACKVEVPYGIVAEAGETAPGLTKIGIIEKRRRDTIRELEKPDPRGRSKKPDECFKKHKDTVGKLRNIGE